MPNLEKLTFEHLGYKEDYNLSNVELKRTKIRSLDISAWPIGDVVGGGDPVEQMNNIFRFVLDSCPLLQEFNLYGHFYFSQRYSKNSCLLFQLHICHLTQLKSVSITNYKCTWLIP